MRDPLVKLRHFRPAGPVSAAFIADDMSVVPAILGPVGGGKSVACVYKGIRRGSTMPICNDGRIRYRRAIIGATYGQIERNLYPTWKRWLPEDGGDVTPIAEWKGGGGRSATHALTWDVVRKVDGVPKRVPVHAEFVFAAVGEQAIEDFVRGFEVTDWWLYEMDLLPRAMLQHAKFRLGRYPATSDEEPDALSRAAADSFVPQVCGDLNAPDIDSWFYKDFEENPVPGHRLYKQPSGLSPNAENRANQRPDYYEARMKELSTEVNSANLIKRMIYAQYAPSLDGEPVYKEYGDDVHLRALIAPDPNLPVYIGLDQGLQRPACVGFQVTPVGQFRVLFEVVPGRMNGRRFAQEIKKALFDVCPGVPLAEIAWCDPVGAFGADKEGGDFAWNEIVSNELGIAVLPAETNEIDARLTAVKDELTYMIDANTPALIVSKKHCPLLRKGFASNYRYKRERIGTSERTSDKPNKADPEADVHDALQYGLLGFKGRAGTVRGARDPRAPERAIGQRARFADDGDRPVVLSQAGSIWDA